MTRAYDEIIDFIASGSTPSAVAGFQPSDEARKQLEDLLTRHKSEQLTSEEAAELDHYLELEHIMRLAKARARRRLAS
jgi:hypothetical protein